MVPHPLAQLSVDEISATRNAVLTTHSNYLIFFRGIFLNEPPKAALKPFLAAEHSGTLSSSTPYPQRQARVQYDIVAKNNKADRRYAEAIVNVHSAETVEFKTFTDAQPSITA